MGGTTSTIKAMAVDLRGQHFVVTGSNSGIGYCNARELAKMGATVTMACRSESRGREALEKLREEALQKPAKEGVTLLEGLEDVDVRLELVDLGSLQSIVDFAKRLRAADTKIDALINNAGIMAIPERRETVDGFEMQIGVNHFGPHLLTRLLEPSIVDGGRIVFVSSVFHDRVGNLPPTTIDWDDPNFAKEDMYDPYQAYGRSKLANVLDAKEFAKRLSGRGIKTYAVHPGVVNTDLFRNMTDDSDFAKTFRLVRPVRSLVLLSPLKGSLTTLKCAVDPALGKPELSGKYWVGLKEKTPSSLASDPANPPRYWDLTEKLLEAKLKKKVEKVIR